MGMNNYSCKLSEDGKERYIELPGLDLGVHPVPGKGYRVHAMLHREPTVVVIHVPGHQTWNGVGRPRRWEPAYFTLFELSKDGTKAAWKGQFLASPRAMEKERQ
jgi:hypothetical protein